MKSVSTAYRNLLFSGLPLLRSDLLTITLAQGIVLRQTSADIDQVFGGHTYTHDLAFTRGGTTQAIGTDPDTIEIDLFDNGVYQVAGASLAQAANAGLFTNAIVQIDKLTMTSWNDLSAGVCGWFTGYVSTPKVMGGQVTLTVKDMRGLLGVAMPKTIIQPQCNNTFGDARCGFNVATVTFGGTCTGGTQMLLTASGLTDHQFDLGKIRFITGANAGVTRSIKSNVGGVIAVAYPFPNVPTAGDTFNISQSCLRTQAACNAYGNSAHFKGAPYVPVPEIALEGGPGVNGGASSTGTTGLQVLGSSTSAVKGGSTFLG